MNIIDATIHTETTRHNVRLMIPILVHWAKIGKTDGTYGNISDILGKGGSQWVGEALLKVQEVIDTLSERSGRNIPTLNVLVKNRATHMPSDGFDAVEPKYSELNDIGKKTFVAGLEQQAFAFPYWDWVLHELDIAPYKPLTSAQIADIKRPHSGYGGGEGKKHKALKEYVKAHPETIGIKHVVRAELEHILPSGDKLDVFFVLKDGTQVAVEVKPSTSDDGDLTRGIFQCVKYKSVMEALRTVETGDYDIQVKLITARPIADIHSILINTLSLNHQILNLNEL